MMIRYLQKLVLFVLPILLALLFALFLPSYAGEFTSLYTIGRIQQSSVPVLYYRTYRDNGPSYKLVAANIRQPEILILGSSRVLEFRSMLFNKMPNQFYNAGRAVSSIYDVYDYLTMLQYYPQTLILGLDDWWFNPNLVMGQSEAYNRLQIELESYGEYGELPFIQATLLHEGSDFLTGKIDFSQILMRKEPVYGIDALGFTAIMSGEGFRNDGSFQYGRVILHPGNSADRISGGIVSIRNNIGGYVGSNEVSQESIHELDKILLFCNDHEITVLGFTTPYAPSVYNAMLKSGRYGYIPLLVDDLKVTFDKYHFRYFDFTDPTPLGITDDDMFDDVHTSEYVSLQLYLSMLNASPDILSKYSDSNSLRTVQRSNHFDVFPP